MVHSVTIVFILLFRPLKHGDVRIVKAANNTNIYSDKIPPIKSIISKYHHTDISSDNIF